MRKPFVALLAFAVALGAVFYVWSRRTERVTVEDLLAPADDPTRPPDALPGPSMGGGELARAPDRAPPPPKPPERAPAAIAVRTGDLLVTLAPPEGVALPEAFRIDAEPIGFSVHVKRLPLEQPDHAWRFDELPVGRWRVRAFVAGFVDVSKDVDVKQDVETPVALSLERGAVATWKVSLLSGAAPETVRVALLDARGVPREATYETSYSTIHAAPGALPPLEATGRVIGLKPGTYRLRATSPEGESDEKSFEVAVGETATVEFTLRR